MSPIAAFLLAATASASVAAASGAPKVRWIELSGGRGIIGGSPSVGQVVVVASTPFAGTFEARLFVLVLGTPSGRYGTLNLPLLPRRGPRHEEHVGTFSAALALQAGEERVLAVRFPTGFSVSPGDRAVVSWWLRDSGRRPVAHGEVDTTAPSATFLPETVEVDPAAPLDLYTQQDPLRWQIVTLSTDVYAALTASDRQHLLQRVVLGKRILLHGDAPRTGSAADDRLFAPGALVWKGADDAEIREAAFGIGLVRIVTRSLHTLPADAQALAARPTPIWPRGPTPSLGHGLDAGQPRSVPPRLWHSVGTIATLLAATFLSTSPRSRRQLPAAIALVLPLAAATAISLQPGHTLGRSFRLLVDDGNSPGVAIQVRSAEGRSASVHVAAEEPEAVLIGARRVSGSPFALRIHEDGRGGFDVGLEGPGPVGSRGLVVASAEVVPTPAIAVVDPAQNELRATQDLTDVVLLADGMVYELGRAVAAGEPIDLSRRNGDAGVPLGLPRHRDLLLTRILTSVGSGAAVGASLRGAPDDLVLVRLHPERHGFLHLIATEDGCGLVLPEILAGDAVPSLPPGCGADHPPKDGFVPVACREEFPRDEVTIPMSTRRESTFSRNPQ